MKKNTQTHFILILIFIAFLNVCFSNNLEKINYLKSDNYLPPCGTVYCPITYANPEAITNVTFAGINRSTGPNGTGGSHQFLCNTGNVEQEGTYPISVNGDTDGNYLNSITVFIDWDQDGNFNNTDERYEIGTFANNNGFGTPITNNIFVPASASLGTTTMRVIKRYDNTIMYALSGCNPSSNYGQTEDYLINVSPSTAPPSCHPITYCSSSYPNGVWAITNVTFAGINNNTAGGTAGGDQEILCDTGNVVAGVTYPISVDGDTTAFNNDFSVTAFFDWNQDGNFNNTDERYEIGILNNVASGLPVTNTIAIPITATIGLTSMRILKDFDPGNAYSNNACASINGYGQTEDYLINITASGPCSTPSSQPTSLSLSATGTLVAGSFTAAIPSPDTYLVIANTTGVTPTLTNGTSYVIGANVGPGNVVIDNDANTVFSATGLNINSTYYFYIFSFNQYCNGGPLYNNVLPLNDSVLTGNYTICIPQTSTDPSPRYINDVEFIGTLNDVSNFGNGSSTGPAGYQNFTSLPNSFQQQGEGMNVYVAGDSRGHLKAWVDWNLDGNFDNATETVYDSGEIGTTSTTFGYSVPLAQPIGTYTLRIRFYNSYALAFPPGSPGYESFVYDFDACETFDSLGVYTEYGEAEDYTFDVVSRCDAQILDILNGEACGIKDPVSISVVGATNVVLYHWYANEIGGSPIGTTTTGTWLTPAISETTAYWVAADNGTCEAYERERVIAFLNAPATLAFTPSIPFICGEDSPAIEIEATSSTQIDYLIDEDFESGLGSFTENNININPVNAPIPDPNISSQWTPQTSVHVPSANVWYPAISSGFGPNNFVMTNGDANIDLAAGEFIENELISSVFDAGTYLDLTLDLEMYFSRYNAIIPEYVNIELSTDGGVTYPIIIDNITEDIGYGTKFNLLSYDLSAYIGLPNLRVRIHYFGEWGDGVAVDNIKLYGTTAINPLAIWSQPPGVQIYEDAAALIPYTGDPRSKIYVLPSVTELQTSAIWSFTATVTLANGCSATGTVSLENKTKYFIGTTNDWNNASNWYPAGVPDANNCIIIPDLQSANIASGINGEGYSLDIQETGTLDIQPNGSVTIQNFVNVDNTGKFTIEDSGSLIQVQDETNTNYVSNTGFIDMKRIANIRKLDYVYWSTPVVDFPTISVSPLTSSGLIYKWLPTVAQGYIGNFGVWQNVNENMINGKGYAIRGPENFDTSFQDYTASFIGIPNNGTITKTITRGNHTGADYSGPSSNMVTKADDNQNLLGNPYPSAISADIFMTLNTEIEGAVHIWTHGTAPNNTTEDPFYEDYGLNYTTDDYITYNLTGASSGPGTFSGYIGAGQGFFVTMEDTGGNTEQVTFNNTMRNKTYLNNDFYKNASVNDKSSRSQNIEKNRIWLDLVGPNNENDRILIGYVTGATLEKDRMYDSSKGTNSNFYLYSKLDDHKLFIQGRPVPFLETDKVELVINIPSEDEFNFAISNVDGLFENENQQIYIEDKKLGIIHNLKENPYTFTGNVGVSDDRFLLRYTDNIILATNTIEEPVEDQILIYKINKEIKVLSSLSKIKNFTMHDINGRILLKKQNINTKEYIVETSNFSTGTYLATVELEDGKRVTKKIIF